MQIGTEFEMIERVKAETNIEQKIDAIEEFSLSGGRQIASELFRNCRKMAHQNPYGILRRNSRITVHIRVSLLGFATLCKSR